MGREIDRRSPWDRPPVNTSTVNNGGSVAEMSFRIIAGSE